MIEKIILDNIIYAIIIRNNYTSNGIEFFTPNSFSQQIGYMKREKGYEIQPHIHQIKTREVHITQEVLYVKSGEIQVDFYNEEQDYLLSKIILKGDLILLSSGGHGFTFLEESEIIEIKQGPFIGEEDKIRFNSNKKEINE
jgi:hypothetical protein